MPAQYLNKTEAGRLEIRVRSLTLSRTARNLLFIIDPEHDTDHWLAMVRGSTEADLQALLAAGLVEVVAPPSRSARAAPPPAGTPAPRPAPSGFRPSRDFAPSENPSLPAGDSTLGGADAPARDAVPRVPLSQALTRVGFRELYDRLTAEARPRLGLINGYRTILAIERATDIEALRELALQFVEQVRQAKGDAAAQDTAQYLADGRAPR